VGSVRSQNCCQKKDKRTDYDENSVSIRHKVPSPKPITHSLRELEGRAQRLEASYIAEQRRDNEMALELNSPPEGESPTVGQASRECSLLRKMGRPEEGLKATEPFVKTAFRALHVTRAAAFCDLELYDKACQSIRIALAIPGTNAEKQEAFSVVRRIKSECPSAWEARHKPPTDDPPTD
jgi:hypothetical protein